MSKDNKGHGPPRIVQTNVPDGLTHPAESLEEFAAHRLEQQKSRLAGETPNTDLPGGPGPRLGVDERPFEERHSSEASVLGRDDELAGLEQDLRWQKAKKGEL